MAMKKVYTCDICRDEIKDRKLYGVVFKDLKTFVIRNCSDTDGTHICYECVKQLKQQLQDISMEGYTND